MKRCTFIILALSAHASTVKADSVTAQLFVNGQQNAAIHAGDPAVVEIRFVHQTEEGETQTVNDFKPVMGKTMHFVAIKRDLSEFAHFHPLLDASSGLFQAPVHLPVLNPDNRDASVAMPTPGHYLLYAEAVSQELGVIVRGLDYKTADDSAEQPLSAQEPDEGIYTVYLTADNTVGSVGDKYKIELHFDTVAGQGGNLIRFFFTLHVLDASLGYQEVSSLEPWLMMGGHAILIGAAGQNTKEKVFAHFHAELPPEGGQLVYPHFAKGGLPSGVYKIWFQAQHQGLVLKVPLVFEY